MKVVQWAAAVALTFVVGCSGGNKGGGGGGSGGGAGAVCPTPESKHYCDQNINCNPCTRLSDAQVASTLGMTAVPGQWNSAVCGWTFNDAQGNPLINVSFGVNGTYSDFEDICHAAPSAGFTMIPVSGVGDDACFFDDGGLGNFEIDFLVGCHPYSVGISGPTVTQPPPFPESTRQAYEKAMALDAVPNL